MAHRYSYLEMYEKNWTFESTSIYCINYVRIKYNYVSLYRIFGVTIRYWDLYYSFAAVAQCARNVIKFLICVRYYRRGD